MRSLIVLCFAAFAIAAPQGYSYSSQPNYQYLAPGTGSGFYGHGAQGYQEQPLVSKRFFIHSALEDEEVEIQQKNFVLGQPRKNFNVVFIKSPASATPKTKVRIIPAVTEEKTVIYVLAKKASENEVTAHVEELHTPTTKPEVYFIKYKTNEEAEHAQHTIQAKYDLLGGSTVISNEGIAPISSVIGSLDSYSDDVGAGVVAATGVDDSNTAYLPPVKKH